MLKSKNSITKSKFKNELHKVTSNELNFPTQADFMEVVKHSFSRNDCEVLLKHVFKRLQSPAEKWRKVLKTLTLVEVLVAKGSKKVIFEFKNKIFLINNLGKFSHFENSIDRGHQSRLNSSRARQSSCRGHQECEPRPLQRLRSHYGCEPNRRRL